MKRYFIFEHVLIFAITLFGLFLLLFRLDNPYLWIDELFTADYIKNDYSYLFALDRPDERHPPGHYVLLKTWIGILGDDRVGLRSMSAAMAVACIPLLYALAKQRLDGRTALVAAFFLAAFPGFIHYGREARMYAQLFVLLMISSLFFFRLFDRFPKSTERERVLLSLVFALALAGTFYTHYTAAVYFVCFAATILLLGIRNKMFRWSFYAVGGMSLATVLVLPQIFHMLDFVTTNQDEWIPYTSIRVFYSMMTGVYTAPKFAKPALYALYLFGLYILYRKDRDLFLFSVSFLVIGPLIMAGIGLIKPVLIVRTLQPLSLLSPILLAIAVLNMPRWLGMVATCFICAISLVSISKDYPPSRQPLLVEIARPFLDSINPRHEAVFHIEDLSYEFRWASVDTSGFIPVTYGSMKNDQIRIMDRLSLCKTDPTCHRILLILEASNQFLPEESAKWLRFAQSAGFIEKEELARYKVFEFKAPLGSRETGPLVPK
ncbi:MULTISPECIES: glycosyltransferase family 39 protein [unclassified Roseibium]|uniref:glycosyltransferase family 39 protein n=1 Tax=unclassified Roseibium TaxID=2629323 RepID=UPI00273FC0B6|nr:MULTISPECIES: glycosyltransferase family 39 protein [unclassified Roseibium]